VVWASLGSLDLSHAAADEAAVDVGTPVDTIVRSHHGFSVTASTSPDATLRSGRECVNSSLEKCHSFYLPVS